MGHHIVTPVFEGPIDLLYHLVATHEVDVLEVPLAPVVDQFVALLVEHRESISTETLSEFLLTAAVLVELKSQRLLPGPDEVEEEEELAGYEARDLLLARLLECRAYAGAADVFVQLAEAAARSLPREAGLDDGFVVHAPDLLAGVRPEQLSQAYLRATAERPVPQVDLSHVTVDTVTVAETVRDLAGRLPRAGRTSFSALTAGLRTRMEVIVHFLALLELCKRGRVALGQGETFGDLTVDWVADPGLIPVGVGGPDEADDVDDYEG